MGKYTMYKCDWCKKESRVGIEYTDLNQIGGGYIWRAIKRSSRFGFSILCNDCHTELEDRVMFVIKDMKSRND